MTRKELADAMLKGVQTRGVAEHRAYYIDSLAYPGFCMACALGAALIGKYGGDFLKAEEVYENRRERPERDGDDMDNAHVLARLLDVSICLAEEVENWHLAGESIEKIAAWLKEES